VPAARRIRCLGERGPALGRDAQVTRRLAGLAPLAAPQPACARTLRLRAGKNGLLRKRKGKEPPDAGPVAAAAEPSPAALLALGGGLFCAVAWAGGQEGLQEPAAPPRLRLTVVEGAYGCARAVADVAAGPAGAHVRAPKALPNGVHAGGAGHAPGAAAGVHAVALGGGGGGSTLALLANGAVLVTRVEARSPRRCPRDSASLQNSSMPGVQNPWRARRACQLGVQLKRERVASRSPPGPSALGLFYRGCSACEAVRLCCAGAAGLAGGAGGRAGRARAWRRAPSVCGRAGAGAAGGQPRAAGVGCAAGGRRARRGRRAGRPGRAPGPQARLRCQAASCASVGVVLVDLHVPLP